MLTPNRRDSVRHAGGDNFFGMIIIYFFNWPLYLYLLKFQRNTKKPANAGR